MSETVPDYQTIGAAATEGLEDLFVEVLPEAGLGRPQVLPSEGLPGDHQGLPVEDVAELLGVSIRTVIKRLRKGTLPGFKVHDKFGDKWVVSPQAILGATHLNDEAGLGGPQVLPSEGLPGDHQGLPIEQTSSTTVQDSVLQVIQKQAEQLQQAYTYLDAATARVLYLQQQLEQKDQELKLLTDSQHKNGWWSHFKKWFFGPVAR